MTYIYHRLIRLAWKLQKKGMFGLKVERDLHFKPVAYKELIK